MLRGRRHDALDRLLSRPPHDSSTPPGQGDQNPDLLRHPQRTGDPGKVSLHMEYAALFEPAEEGGFVITIPDFGWGFSQGDTEVEARQMAAALLQTLVQEHIRKRETLPRPTKRRGRKYRFVRLSALQGAKAELYMAFLASGDAQGRNGAPSRHTEDQRRPAI